MKELNIEELEQVADAYASRLAPALMEEWTERVADLAGIESGQRILDVACGTGILTRVVAERNGTPGRVTGVDINPGMLAVAKRISPEINWREAAAEALPCDDSSFDTIVCQFGLMLFTDPQKALQEMLRVLRPKGRLVLAVFGSLDTLPAYAAMSEIFGRVIDTQVGDALRLPFSMGEEEKLEALFKESGFLSVSIDTYTGKAHFESVRDMVLSDVLGWFPFAGIQVNDSEIATVVEEAEKALTAFISSEGIVEFPVPVRIVSTIKEDA